MLLQDLSRKTILVTGASKGIGEETTLLLSRMGARVLALARDLPLLKKLERKCPTKIIPVKIDLENHTEIEHAIKNIKEPIHGIVHNAGFFNPAPLSDITIDDWNKHININLTAAMLITQGLWDRFIESAPVSILYVSSLAGVQNMQKFPTSSSYVASKMGLVGLAEVVAAEGKEHNIRANVISPGATNTKMLRTAYPNLKADFQPKHIAKTILWYLSDDSAPISGSQVVVRVAD